MGFEYQELSQRVEYEESIEEHKFIIIACEGESTEPQYFNHIKENMETKINIKMEILNRDKAHQGSSSPTQVTQTLQSLTHERLQEIKEKNLSLDSFDIYWIVIDRETQESKIRNLEKALEICKEEEYNVALTNPNFEFWLLLHLENIEQYNYEDLAKNRKPSKKAKRFIEKELSQRLEGGYGKKKGGFNVNIMTIENIKRAIEQEGLFANSVEEIKYSLGSNVGRLVEEILVLE